MSCQGHSRQRHSHKASTQLRLSDIDNDLLVSLATPRTGALWRFLSLPKIGPDCGLRHYRGAAAALEPKTRDPPFPSPRAGRG